MTHPLVDSCASLPGEVTRGVVSASVCRNARVPLGDLPRIGLIVPSTGDTCDPAAPAATDTPGT